MWCDCLGVYLCLYANHQIHSSVLESLVIGPCLSAIPLPKLHVEHKHRQHSTIETCPARVISVDPRSYPPVSYKAFLPGLRKLDLGNPFRVTSLRFLISSCFTWLGRRTSAHSSFLRPVGSDTGISFRFRTQYLPRPAHGGST